MTPTLNQLASFCIVAEIGNMSRAAEKLNISQPPLSRQIAQLERILGTTLFTRNAKGMRLTLAGEQFLVDARAVLNLMQQACNNVQAVAAGQRGLLKLGATMYASYSVIPPVTMKHQANQPDIVLQFQEMIPTELNTALQDGRLDAAISFAERPTPGINTMILLQEPLIIALPTTHPQATAEHFSLSELNKDRFITVPRLMAPMLYDTILHQCLKAGFSPQIGMEVSVQQTIVNFVAYGFGVALIPASMENAQIKGVIYRKIEDANQIQNVLMWSDKNRNPCLKHFLKMCRAIRDNLLAAQQD
ncbi:transcriptional regulator, LysR family [Serratia sp. JKS296]|uniref:LysR family transcriptional regulator n=1 Tax=Serratia sp. JKS296 TaxID=1938824 RepID=UPI000BDC849C|nr:LysR family transcriptional regulator [Serratia sp. JKS296]SOD79489.1 transcriptional regulator, LysR family [Serratia sp. JKS296]